MARTGIERLQVLRAALREKELEVLRLNAERSKLEVYSRQREDVVKFLSEIAESSSKFKHDAQGLLDDIENQ